MSAARSDKPPRPRERLGVAKGKRSTPRQQLQRSEQETRRDLSRFTDLLAENVANSLKAEGLTKEERERLIRQGKIFSSSVAELKVILADHPHEDVREYRLYKLFEALGMACVLSQVVDPIRNRLRAAPATNAKQTASQRAQDIVAEEAMPIWRDKPSYTPWRVAGDIRERVNQRLGSEGLLRLDDKRVPIPLTRGAIAKRLKGLRPDA